MREIHEINNMEIQEILKNIEYIITRFGTSKYITENERVLLQNIKNKKEQISSKASNRFLKKLELFYQEMMKKYGHLPLETINHDTTKIEDKEEDEFGEYLDDDDFDGFDKIEEEEDKEEDKFGEYFDDDDFDGFDKIEEEEVEEEDIFDRLLKSQKELTQKKKYEDLLYSIQNELDKLPEEVNWVEELLSSASFNINSNDLVNAKNRLARIKDKDRDRDREIDETDLKGE